MRVDELGIMRIELDNYIGGLEISKAAVPSSWGKYDEKVLNLLKRVADVLRRVEPKEDWIPVTERLPEKTGKYLVSVKNGNVYAGTFSAYEGAFNCAATAWMELPEPYKEPEDPSHPCADSVLMGD